MKTKIIPILTALLGILIGFLASAQFKDTAAETKSESTKVVKHAEGKARVKDSSNASMLALRERIRNLEKQLADAQNALAASNKVVAQKSEATPRAPHGPDGFRRHLEEMRTKDPARYAQITNRMSTFRANRLRQVENRINTLANIDTSRMSDQERTTHERLQELLAKREEMFETLHPENNGENELTEEQRRKRFGEIRALSHEIRELEEAERNTLLTQTANDLGFSGEDASDVVNAIKTIYETTQSRGGPGGPPPGGGGPGGPR